MAGVVVACAAAVATLLAVSKEAEATFPGKNGRIAYVDSGVIYTINPDGSAKTKVTTIRKGGNVYYYPIDYSPDGKRIAYEGYYGHDSEIYTVGVGGRGKFQVTKNGRYDAEPSYSPDGKRIAYAGYDGHDTEIYTIGVHGKNRVRLTNNSTDDYGPVYSPGGRRIAFEGLVRRSDYYTTAMYTIRARGGVKTKLTAKGGEPDYSSDGKRIAYTGGDGHDGEIYTMDVGGGRGKKVTNNIRYDSGPSYSPDGKKIAYVSYEGGPNDNFDIYTIDVGGGVGYKVTGTKSLDSNPSWGIRP